MGTLHPRNPSLWVATTEPGDEDLTGAVEGTYDVVVIGAGITGLTTARLLVDEGASVAAVEAGHVCSGVTGYTTAKVSALQQTALSTVREKHGDERAAMYALANREGVEVVARLVEADDIECDFERAPACTYTATAEEVDTINAEHEAGVVAGLPVRLDANTELPFEVHAAVWLDDQVQLHPRRYCLGLLDAIRSRGASVHVRTRALDVDEDDDGCTVRTDRGDLRASNVVVATLLPFLDSGGFFARAHPYRSYAMAVRIQAERPKGMYINAESPTRSVRSTTDGWVIISGEGHKTGEDDDTRQRYQALEDWTREHYDVTEVGYRWSAQDYKSVDEVPYVGRAGPRHHRTFVGTGFRKWGMSNGTAAAVMLSDLLAGRDNPWFEAFDATRLEPGASIKKLVSENLDVGKRFVADRVRQWRRRPVDDLELGEGDVVDIDGDPVAAFRDDDGRVHAVSPTCTHLGCRLAFNTAERSWDCPCHGSRFDVDGHVVQGPAVEDLAPHDLG